MVGQSAGRSGERAAVDCDTRRYGYKGEGEDERTVTTCRVRERLRVRTRGCVRLPVEREACAGGLRQRRACGLVDGKVQGNDGITALRIGQCRRFGAACGIGLAIRGPKVGATSGGRLAGTGILVDEQTDGQCRITAISIRQRLNIGPRTRVRLAVDRVTALCGTQGPEGRLTNRQEK